MKHQVNVLSCLFLIGTLFLLSGCSTKPQAKSEPGISKQQVMEALIKVAGQQDAERTYNAWRAEVRKQAPDDETAHRIILQRLDLINKMVTAMKERVDATKDKLLHKIDHEAVLTASRRVIDTRREYGHNPAVHGPGPRPEISHVAGDDPKLPVVLRELQPARIMASSDRVRIEFGGGFHHQGLIALADAQASLPKSKGVQRLIDGLYFYEDTN